MSTITFKGSPIHTVGSLPATGGKAPDFKLVKQDLSEAVLSTLPHKKKVLNIVPSLDTGTCALSAKTFYNKLSQRDDVLLFNISMDLPFAQGRFCKAEGLTNAETLSAFRSDFADVYGVKIIEGPLEGLCSRAVILLDENNNVIYTEQVGDISHEPNYDKLLEHLQ
jgi:thiol peroxidase